MWCFWLIVFCGKCVDLATVCGWVHFEHANSGQQVFALTSSLPCSISSHIHPNIYSLWSYTFFLSHKILLVFCFFFLSVVFLHFPWASSSNCGSNGGGGGGGGGHLHCNVYRPSVHHHFVATPSPLTKIIKWTVQLKYSCSNSDSNSFFICFDWPS